MTSIIHFQKKLQTRLCCAGRSTHVTLKIEEVTCKTCKSKLGLLARQKHNATVNWSNVYESVKALLPKIKLAILEFGIARPWCKYSYAVENYPPKIVMSFWVPESKNHRRRTEGYHIPGKDRMQPNVIQVHIPTEEEMEDIASFVGALAESYQLRPFRANRGAPVLDYELKPVYGGGK